MTTRLCVRDLYKRFGPTRALAGASLSVLPGEVHALLGENGAGKSTLIKIIAGAFEPDSGSMSLDGLDYAPRAPEHARSSGIAVVHQEPLLCPDLSVLENVLLGVESTRFGLLQRRTCRERALEALRRVRVADGVRAISLETRASELSPAAAQLVAIARALAQSHCRVLVLDEPTSSLSASDAERLFSVVRELSESGIAVVYISHFLEEVRRVASTYSVLRDGASAGSGKLSDVTSRDLVALMAGRRVEQAFVRSERHRSAGPVLQVEELRGASLPERASLELYRGEVLGIAGLVGSGRTELLRAIFGLDVVRSGRVRVASFSGGATPARRLSQGVGLLSEDRKREGLAGNLSIAENVTLSKPMRSRFFGLISPSQQQRVAEHWIERLRIRAHGPSQVVRDLSGGNQQKVALARLLHHDIDVALLDEPTRGIDVGSRADIYRLIDDLACSGKAVLLVSSYFPELLGVADRIAVMHRGVLGPATPVTELDEHALIARAIGA